jgi:hypothetical protein
VILSVGEADGDMKKLSGGRQTTIQDDIVLSGIGVHSGKEASVILHPAEANTGWVFLVPNDAGRFSRIPADYRWVSNVTLCTVLSDARGNSVSTVEHLLAALRGMGVDNVEIEIEGGELPILDGSAAPFVDAIDEVGLRVLDDARRYIKILKPIRAPRRPLTGKDFPELAEHEAEIQDRYGAAPGQFKRKGGLLDWVTGRGRPNEQQGQDRTPPTLEPLRPIDEQPGQGAPAEDRAANQDGFSGRDAKATGRGRNGDEPLEMPKFLKRPLN